MSDGSQNVRIQPCKSSQLLGIHAITLSIVATDGVQFPHVRHDYLVSISTKLFVDPDRMRSVFNRNPKTANTFKVFSQCGGCCTNPAFLDYFAIIGQQTVMTPLITNIDANREPARTLFLLR
jgi:hypothetical protein